MRTALVSLIATAALVGAAEAQTPAAPTPQTATPQTATPASPATTQPPPATTAAPATAATPPATTTAPPEGTPAPGATATPAAPAEEAPPTLPTTGDGAAIISLVEKVCVPLVRGGKLDDIAKANAATLGLRKNRRDNSWTMPLGTNRDYNVTILPVGANKDVCRGEVHYALNQDKPIVEAINIWSFLHKPELILQANYVAVDPDGIKRIRKSWEHLDSTSSTAINFSTWTKPDDSSLNPKYSTGEIFYQERKF